MQRDRTLRYAASVALLLPAWLALATTAEATPAAVGDSSQAASATSQNAKRGGKKRPRRKQPKARAKGSKAGTPNAGVRRMLTGDYPDHSTAEPTVSRELKTLERVDRALFPPVKAPASVPWALSFKHSGTQPSVDVSGLPAKTATTKPAAPKPTSSADAAWIASLKMPDLPIRIDASVVRYLKYYRDNPRGRGLVAALVRKSGRYRDAIRKVLLQHNLPTDLMWLAMIESSFDATIHSHAGAAGLWQFIPATGRIYGLTVTRSVDERLDPERATLAGIRHLKDLHQRFGTWELAFAAYNMGFGGISAAVRKYNTNDYWQLRRYEAGLPYETALYVPKIMALAVASKNCKVFGCDKVVLEKPLPFGDAGRDKLSVAQGTTLQQIAKAAKLDPDALKAHNPHLIGKRLPPLQHATLPRKSWTVFLPSGQAAKVGGKIAKRVRAPKLATHRVRWGESLAHIAARYGTRKSTLRQLNDLYNHEAPRPTRALFVPAGRTPKTDAQVAKALDPIVVVVPPESFTYPDRRRTIYVASFGDTPEGVAQACGVGLSELRRWNKLDRRANLQWGMQLQVFVPRDAKPPSALLFEESEVTLLTLGSPEYFDHFVTNAGKRRLVLNAKSGDTLRSLAKRYQVSSRDLERINHRARYSKLKDGDTVVVYVKQSVLARLQAQKKKTAAKTAVKKPKSVSDGKATRNVEAAKPARVAALPPHADAPEANALPKIVAPPTP